MKSGGADMLFSIIFTIIMLYIIFKISMFFFGILVSALGFVLGLILYLLLGLVGVFFLGLTALALPAILVGGAIALLAGK